PVPGSDLSVAVTIPAATDWLPPAGGLLSLALASAPLPPIPPGLAGPSGTPPLPTGCRSPCFRLLPEAERRLGPLLSALPPADVRLFAFDERGRPVDPGAVAAWWARLTTTFSNLFAAGVSQRIATVDDQLTVQLAGPDDAPASDAVLSRLSVTNVTGTGPVRV